MENKRWLYAGVGTIIMLFAGLIYAWSVLASPISAFFTDWTQSQISLTFTICMSFFCIGGLCGGLLAKKVNVKMNMILSGIFLCAGFLISSRTDSLAMLYIGYGILAGFGSGFVYNGIMSCLNKWFADKPGLISGILLMGFGFGSFIIGKVYQAFTPSGEGIDAWRNSFFIFGIILIVVMVLGALIIKAPGADYKAPAPVKKESKSKKEEGIDIGPGQMLKRASFWLYIVWATTLSAAGLILISQASGVVAEINPQASASTVATVVGLISILNGIGRVICGALFDRIGRRATMFLFDIIFFVAVGLLIFALTSHSFIMIIIAFCVSGFAYGGVTPTNSAFASGFYGTTHYPVNYPIINLNLLIASFGSTIAGALYDASGSYMSTFMLMLGTVIVATVASIFIRRP